MSQSQVLEPIGLEKKETILRDGFEWQGQREAGGEYMKFHVTVPAASTTRTSRIMPAFM
jgi:hypothetical protein